MVLDKESNRGRIIIIHDDQRYFKVTAKGRAPKVTREWKVKDTPWYIRYAFDWILFLFAIPFIVARALVSDGGWFAFILEAVLVGIFIMWLVTLTSE
jgi:hypothetical protein